MRRPLALHLVATSDEYLVYMDQMNEEHQRRRQVERSLVSDQSPFTLLGLCSVCHARASFAVDFSHSCRVDGELTPNWREHLICPGCNLNNRMRAAIHIFEQQCTPARTSHVYVTEQTTPLFRTLCAKYPNVVGSEYLGDTLPFGTTDKNGIRNESVTSLTFPSNTFDQILSFDVLEHIPNYEKGFTECFRCLKPGGLLLFSVPFTGKAKTLVRARMNADCSIDHLAPPEYHGDPLNSKGCLCYYHFGWDLLDVVRGVGFYNVAALMYWSREFGYLGNGDQIIFVAKKPATPGTLARPKNHA